MFNREIRVNWVKKTKTEDVVTEPKEDLFERRAAIVSSSIDKSLRWIGSAVVTYVVVDTVRQILVARASKS